MGGYFGVFCLSSQIAIASQRAFREDLKSLKAWSSRGPFCGVATFRNGCVSASRSFGNASPDPHPRRVTPLTMHQPALPLCRCRRLREFKGVAQTGKMSSQARMAMVCACYHSHVHAIHGRKRRLSDGFGRPITHSLVGAHGLSRAPTPRMGPSRPPHTSSYHGRAHAFIRHHHGLTGRLLSHHLQAQGFVFRCPSLLPLVQPEGQGATRQPPHARRSGSLSPRRGLSLLRTPGGGS